MDVRIAIKKRLRQIENGREKEDLNGEDYYSCWATPIDLYGDELYQSLAGKLENVLIFEVRYCKKIKELRNQLKEYFVEFEGNRYEIYHINYKRNTKQKVLLKVKLII